VDSMQRELGTWQRTNTDLRAQLRTEHRCVTFVCRLYFNATVNNFKETSKSITGFSLLWKHDLRSLHGIMCVLLQPHTTADRTNETSPEATGAEHRGATKPTEHSQGHCFAE
jgi:hypothetical protein